MSLSVIRFRFHDFTEKSVLNWYSIGYGRMDGVIKVW